MADLNVVEKVEVDGVKVSDTTVLARRIKVKSEED